LHYTKGIEDRTIKKTCGVIQFSHWYEQHSCFGSEPEIQVSCTEELSLVSDDFRGIAKL